MLGWLSKCLFVQKPYRLVYDGRESFFSERRDAELHGAYEAARLQTETRVFLGDELVATYKPH